MNAPTSLPVAAPAAAPKSMAKATTYAEWKAAALAADENSGAAAWRREERSRRYDYRAIRSRLDELMALKDSGDIHALLFLLNEGIHGNMGGMGRPTLYNRTKFGTKDLITNYIAELADAIERVARVDESEIPFPEKIEFFRRASHCFGRSALMFSGGGALGPFHLGVAKALLEQQLLPTVISGASAGSFVAATLGTHTDDELVALFDGRPLMNALEEMSETTAVEARGNRRLAIDDVHDAIAQMVPDLTFAEAFELTGRKINITVSPAEEHQSSRLMNAVTSPNVCIRETVLASCAIPGVFPAVTLAAKNRFGERQPYVPLRKWVDGSISDDLPAKRLARLYGVNHFISSQTNPVVLWAVRDSGFDDSLLTRFMDIYQSAGREWLRATWPFAMRAIKDQYPLNMYARMAYSVAIQDYTADINILPSRRLFDPRKLLSILTDEETRALIHEGERAAWPKIEMIRNCTLVGRTLDRACDDLEHEFAVRAMHVHGNRDYVEKDWSPH
jgi:NTE family protein